MSNEKQIREAVKDYIRESFKNITITEEFGVFLDSRNDVMGINLEDIVTIEIKSNRDTFARLEKQLKTYKRYSTIVYVALDKCHYKNYIKKFRNNENYKFHEVGVLIWENNHLTLVHNPHRTNFKMVYSLLNSKEHFLFFNYFKGKSLIPKNYETSMTIIESIFTYKEIYEISKYIFVNRFTNHAQFFPKDLIKDFDYKQAKFDEWLDISNWHTSKNKIYNWLPKSKQPRERIKRSSLKILDELNKKNFSWRNDVNFN